MIKHLTPLPKYKVIMSLFKESHLRWLIVIALATDAVQITLRFIADDWSFPRNLHVIAWSVWLIILCILQYNQIKEKFKNE